MTTLKLRGRERGLLATLGQFTSHRGMMEHRSKKSATRYYKCAHNSGGFWYTSTYRAAIAAKNIQLNEKKFPNPWKISK